MTPITAAKIRKQYGGKTIIQDVTFTAKKGKTTAIFGPNGSGKTTLLNIIAGLTRPDGGAVDASYSPFTCSYMFQNYRESLLPWRDNWGNLSYPLEIQGKDRREIRERVEEADGFFRKRVDLKKYPYELSGGQQQLLAFMRTLITKPTLLLLDEPFSALDYEVNLWLRVKLQEYQQKAGATIIAVTHDVDEAVHIADEIIVLSKNPTHVAGTIRNKISRPRDAITLTSQKFIKTRKDVLELFARETQ
ncbi:Trehalose/maltose import ATP-binding protein MalK [uncultured archaeon]|nr:Trehalose/maltose import ATP-binding protein MalK [uncultured archaeon]